MIQKYKTPEIMQEKGVDFHTKLLKKTIKAMISAKEKEIQPFFYNTEFDFGNEVVHPILYIGPFPSKWKKYLKAKKRAESFASGLCIIDDKGLLKIQITVGKGGKELILNKINKILLKPFCKAYVVETITIETAIESQIEDKEALPNDDTKEENEAFRNWVKTSRSLIKDSNQALKSNLKVLKEFEKPMSKLKDIVVTDDFIAKAMKAKSELKNLDVYVLNLKSLCKERKTYNEKPKKADNLVDLLSKQIKQIDDNKTKVDLMIKNMEGLKQISNPKDAEIPIIDDNPIVNFLNRTRKSYT